MRLPVTLLGVLLIAGLAGCFGVPDDGTAQYGSTVELGLEIRDGASDRVILPMQEGLSGPTVLRRGDEPFGLPGLARALRGAEPNETVTVDVDPDPRYEDVRVPRYLDDLEAVQEVRRGDLVSRIDPMEAQNLAEGLRLRWVGGYRYEVTEVTGNTTNDTVALSFVGPEQVVPRFEIAANVTAIREGDVVRQRVDPLRDGLWVKVNSPFAPPTPLEVPEGIYRHLGVDGEELVMGRVDLDISRLGHLFDKPIRVVVALESVTSSAQDPYARPADDAEHHGVRSSPHLG